MVPVQIRAQVLRQPPFAALAGIPAAFALMPERPAPPGGDETRRRAPWRQADLRRAIAAAEQAGLESYRVEIAPDGTISIIVGAPSETAPVPDPG